MVAVNVAGGTRAGWRRLKPRPLEWDHWCKDVPFRQFSKLPAHWSRCPDCGARRP